MSWGGSFLAEEGASILHKFGPGHLQMRGLSGDEALAASGGHTRTPPGRRVAELRLL